MLNIHVCYYLPFHVSLHSASPPEHRPSHKRKAVPRKIVKDNPVKEDTVKEEKDL